MLQETFPLNYRNDHRSKYKKKKKRMLQEEKLMKGRRSLNVSLKISVLYKIGFNWKDP